LSDQPEADDRPASAELAAALPEVQPGQDLEQVEPDEILIRITDDRVIAFTAQRDDVSAVGRWLAVPSARELKSVLRHLDPAARALIEAKRLTGALVELHPSDREMFKTGLKAIKEEGDWLQANFRNRGQVVRIMRIRPAAGLAVASGGAMALAAVAAQAQAAELTQDIKAIRQRVDQMYQHLQDDQIGAVEHAVQQVEDLVAMLRAHGSDGVDASRVSVVGNALGDASRKCVQHLKTAVANLENAGGGSARHSEQILSESAVQDVMLYLDLAASLDVAAVQFGLAEVAFDCHLERPHVAKTRAEQITASIRASRLEVDELRGRLNRLDASVRAQVLPWWKHARNEIASKAGLGTAGGAAAGVAVAVGPDVAEAAAGAVANDGGGKDDRAGPNLGAAAAFGAVAGLVGGIALGTRNAVNEVRAKKPLEARLSQLTEASSRYLEPPGETTPVLEWLNVLTEELPQSVTEPLGELEQRSPKLP
jgi:hypothetical protein